MKNKILAASAATAAVTVTTAAGAVSLTTAGAMVAGFAAGVASSLVSQGVGLAIHEQNGFSLKSLLLTGTESALSAGMLGGAAPFQTTANTTTAMTMEKVFQKAIEFGANDAMDQVLEMMSGNRPQFNFLSIAANMVNGLTDMKMPALPDAGVTAALEGTENTLVGDALSHTAVNPAQLASASLGSYLGTEASSTLEQKLAPAQPKQTQTQAQAQQSRTQAMNGQNTGTTQIPVSGQGSGNMQSGATNQSTTNPRSNTQQAPTRYQVEHSLQEAETTQDMINLQLPSISIDVNNPQVASTLGSGLAQMNAAQQRASAAAGSSVTSGLFNTATTSNGSTDGVYYNPFPRTASSSTTSSGFSNPFPRAQTWNSTSSSTSASSNTSSFWSQSSSLASRAENYISNSFWSGIDIINRAGNFVANEEMSIGRNMINYSNAIINGDSVFARLGGVLGLAETIVPLIPADAMMSTAIRGIEIGASQLAKFGLFADDTIKYLDPNEIRFSQQSVSYLKQRSEDSYTIDDIKNSMLTEGWQGRPIDVVKMPNGELVTIDNTRVLVARDTSVDVKANIRAYNERLPEGMEERFNHPVLTDEYAETWGEALEYRMMRQNMDFQNAYYPNGSPNLPRIRYPSSSN